MKDQHKKVDFFVAQDPNADLIGRDFSVYITQKNAKKEGYEFQGYIWKEKVCGIINEGYISPSSISFIVNYDSPKTEDYVTNKDNEHKGHHLPQAVKYVGEFYSITSWYQGKYFEPSGQKECVQDIRGHNFSLKNQKVVFSPPKPKPSSPFFLYRQHVFPDFQRQNPDMKPSKLTALVTNVWNDLDEANRSVYVKKYEELTNQFQQFWQNLLKGAYPNKREESITDEEFEENHQDSKESKKTKVNQENRYLIHIFEYIEYREECCDFDREEDATLYRKEFENYWDSAAAGVDAIAIVRERYRAVRERYERHKVSLPSGRFGDGADETRRYSDPILKFDATIIDLVDGKASIVPEDRLHRELYKEMQRLPQTKRYLISDILRKKDFDDQTVKEVLVFLPKIELKFSTEDNKEYKSYDGQTLAEMIGGLQEMMPGKIKVVPIVAGPQ